METCYDKIQCNTWMTQSFLAVTKIRYRLSLIYTLLWSESQQIRDQTPVQSICDENTCLCEKAFRLQLKTRKVQKHNSRQLPNWYWWQRLTTLTLFLTGMLQFQQIISLENPFHSNVVTRLEPKLPKATSGPLTELTTSTYRLCDSV